MGCLIGTARWEELLTEQVAMFACWAIRDHSANTSEERGEVYCEPFLVRTRLSFPTSNIRHQRNYPVYISTHSKRRDRRCGFNTRVAYLCTVGGREHALANPTLRSVDICSPRMNTCDKMIRQSLTGRMTKKTHGGVW